MSDLNQTGTESGDCSPATDARPVERSEPFGGEPDFLSTALGVVLVTDARGLIVWANEPNQDVSGYSPAEVRGRFIWELAKPAQREAARRYFEHALSGHVSLGEHQPTHGEARQSQPGLERAVALAHELSQPLEVIASYAQAGLLQVRKRPFDADKLTDSLEKIALQIQLAAEILRDVREAR